MGVAMVGVGAYRDEEGNLCTFEYVAPFFWNSFPWLKFNFPH